QLVSDRARLNLVGWGGLQALLYRIGMASIDDLPAAAAAAAPAPQSAVEPSRGLRAFRIVLTRPVTTFVFLSLLFGTLTIALTPPLEGPDAPAHFMLACWLSVGDVVR